MTSPAEARAFARSHSEARLESPTAAVHAHVAFTPEGHPLIATEVAPPGGRLRVRLEGPGGAQLSIEGDALALAPGDEVRLLAIHPAAAAHRRRIEPLAVHWTDASGAEAKLEPAAWLLATPEWREGEAGINEHMNDDHVDAMQRMCRVYCGLDAEAPRLVAVDPEGLVLRAGAELVHIAFDAPAHTHEDVHQATVRLAREARISEEASTGDA